MVPPDAFRRQVLNHRKDLWQIQDSVEYAQEIISKEQDIGPGQCTRLVNSIRSAENPLREFYALLDTPEQLPLAARSHRHPLLIILDNATGLLHDLINSISTLHEVYRTSSYQEADFSRQQILDQLDAFIQRKDDIVDNIDSLLLQANAYK
ncbi:MAG TPA: hypothetical protein VKY19_29735 [Ktedonosporobacter sp.]|jgi:hypothetical protein|nr:hypothetical protein [Ktedonosporobacter sp.]